MKRVNFSEKGVSKEYKNSKFIELIGKPTFRRLICCESWGQLMVAEKTFLLKGKATKSGYAMSIKRRKVPLLIMQLFPKLLSKRDIPKNIVIFCRKRYLERLMIGKKQLRHRQKKASRNQLSRMSIQRSRKRKFERKNLS